MTIEMTSNEAELLLAILLGVERTGIVMYPELSEALKDLQPFRSALLQSYLRAKLEIYADERK